jgi:(p)ppGpp synthase/HD superfamily hydrolase
MMELTERFRHAVDWAVRLHAGQVRKGTTVPYVAHLLGAASIALDNGADEDQAIAAILHDAVEDCGGAPVLAEIRSRFGERVAGIVADCTDSDGEPKPPWAERKRAYLAALEAKPSESLLVSLADKTHNAEAIVQDLREHGEPLWGRFTAGKEGSLWYYGELAGAFQRALPGRGADRLSRAVREMHTLSAGPLADAAPAAAPRR